MTIYLTPISMNFSNYEQEAKAHGLSSGYYKLAQGDNRIKIVKEPEHFGSHFQGKGKSSAACLGKDCPLCKQGVKLSHRVMLYVIDRKDEQVKLAEFPWSVFEAIGKIAKSEDYGFTGLPDFDLTITKTGEGMETEYSVLPGRKSTSMTKDQEAELAKKEAVAKIIAKKLAEARASMADEVFA